MTPVPLTKIQDALDKLAPYMDQRLPIDEMTLRRIKGEVERNMGVDPYLGSVVLGNIAILQWDLEEFEAQYRNALRLSNGAQSHYYYALALQLVGRFYEASEYARSASELAPTDLGILRDAILFTFYSGQFTLAATLCESYNMRSPMQPYPDEDAIESARQTVIKAGLDEAMLVECNRIAFDLLREKKSPYSSTSVESDIRDGLVMFYIKLDRSIEFVDELDQELGERLFDRVANFDPSKYWIGYAVEEAS